MTILLEACAENFCGALEAFQKGANRIELCDNLAVGGTTVSAGTLAAAADTIPLPLAVLIRPRGGDFAYTEDEKRIILADIAFASEFSPEGLVVGALLQDGAFDAPFMQKMRSAIKGSSAVCHMGFDDTPNLAESLELLIGWGYDRVLTKGGQGSAPGNAAVLQQLVQQAAGRITVLPGGGITAANFQEVARLTGAGELHGTKIV